MYMELLFSIYKMVANLFTCMTTEVFSRGVWKVLDTLVHPEQQRLVHSLPQTVLASRADNTMTKYLYGFTKRKFWAEIKKGVNTFPLHDVQFSLCLPSSIWQSPQTPKLQWRKSELQLMGTSAGKDSPLHNGSFCVHRLGRLTAVAGKANAEKGASQH